MTTVSGDGPRTPYDGPGDGEEFDAPPDAFYDTRPVAGLPLADPATGPAAQSSSDPSAAPTDGSGGRAARRKPPKPPRPGTPSPAGRVILPIALAAVSVVALVAGWNRLQTDEAAVAAPAPAASSPAPATPSAAPATTAPASPAASPSAAATSAPPASASPSRTPTPSPSASATGSPSPSVAFTVDRSVPVTVLNGTTRPGLAAAVAADLEAKGWRIVSTGNWRSGGIESTTVFVDGERNAALTMRQDLPAADATRTPIGAMKDGRITIVVLDDYPR